MFAIIETGGKQYRVCVGDVLDVERLEAGEGVSVDLKALLVGEGENIVVGKACEGKVVKATVVKQFKSAKVVVFRYKAKKNERKKNGHRQYYTRIKIDAIV